MSYDPDVLKLMAAKLRLQLNDNRAAVRTLVATAAENCKPPYPVTDVDTAMDWAYGLEIGQIVRAIETDGLRVLLT